MQPIFIGGDILAAVDGYEITSLDSLQILLEDQHQVGDEVKVTVIRESGKQVLKMTLAEEPAQ